MAPELRKSGLDFVGDIPWGKHICCFYRGERDLLDLLVSYVRAGLENNELCVWIVAPPLTVAEAKTALEGAVKNLNPGQVEILDASQWYLKSGRFEADEVLKGWWGKEKQALERGFDGLRVTGDTSWLGIENREDFLSYETTLGNILNGHRVIAICSYPLDRLAAAEVIQVVNSHEAALIRWDSEWVCLKCTEREESQELLRRLVASSPVGVYIFQDGKFVFANNQFQKITGYTEEELLGPSPFGIVHPEDRAFVQENVSKMLKGERSSPFEYRGVTRDGQEKWVMQSVSPIQYRGRRAVLGFFMDITERKQADARLAAQKRLTDRILASSPNAILVANRETQIVLVNPAFGEFFMMESAEVEGRQVGDVLPLEGLTEAVSKTFAERKPQPGQEFRYKVDGGERILSAQITPMKGEEKKEEVLVILRDVTMERAQQEQLYHIDRLASLGEMVAAIAHELNNPLTGVIGYSELILNAELPGPVKKDVEVIHENAQRAANVIRNLLTFARRDKPRKMAVSVNKVVKRIVEIYRYDLEVSNITVFTELAAGLPIVRADPQQLEQVFLNIIRNAEQAMLEAHGQGNLTVRTELREDRIRISFADDGPGISKENMRRLFTPFFTTKPAGKGTGLGLSICHGIITGHEGRIYAESEEGKGATFFIELPISGETTL